MTLNTIISVVGLIGSIIALYFSSKKNDSEVDNIDADTISTLYDTISKQDKYYKDCQKEQDACYQQLKKEATPGDLFHRHTVSDYFIQKSLIFAISKGQFLKEIIATGGIPFILNPLKASGSR